MKGTRFQIDFFEFSFLVEACIPPRPIARAMFWNDVIDKYYDMMTPTERKQLYEWIRKNRTFDDGLEKGNEDCRLFEARYNPNNQYRVTTKYNGETKEQDCFKMNGQYYLSSKVSI